MEYAALIVSSLVVKISAEDYKAAIEAAQKIADSLSKKTGVHYAVESVQND